MMAALNTVVVADVAADVASVLVLLLCVGSIPFPPPLLLV